MFPHEIFWYCETKKFDGKSWYDNNFSRSQIIWNLGVVTTNFFRFCETEKIRQKNVVFRFHEQKVSIPEIFPKVEGVTLEIFQDCEAEKIKGESRYPATEHKSLRCPKGSETKRDSLPSFIGSIREKNSTDKSDITLLGIKFFDSRTILIYRSVPQRNLSALWGEKLSTENLDIPFLFNLFFDTSHFKLFETLDGSSRNFSVMWDKKNRRKTVIRMKVSDFSSFLKLRSGSQEIFANCETEFFDWRTWFSVLRHGKFRYPKISGRLKSLPTKFFSTVRPKKSTENRKIFDWMSWYSVLLHKFFRYLAIETVWNPRWFFTKFFATVRQKKWRKNVICRNFSEIPNILNLRSRSQKFFAYCETKKIQWRTWFSVLMHRKTRYPNISGRLKGLSTKFFRTVRPKNSKENWDTPLLSIQVFDVPKILKQTGIPYRDF